MITLVTGAARSGKSEWAELLATRSQKTITYIATAMSNPDDLEWQAKIQQHRDRRPDYWQVLEIPIALDEAINLSNPGDYLLVDSLGTWLANLLEQDVATWEQTAQKLICAIQSCQADITLVAEEVGWGVVPAYELGRLFRDRLGSLSRNVGAIADVVYLVTGGHAVNLCSIGERLPPLIPKNKPWYG
jgi:adenosylcobinamide kinase / adenosylcobinamide-phosphate guanylyltransferase